MINLKIEHILVVGNMINYNNHEDDYFEECESFEIKDTHYDSIINILNNRTHIDYNFAKLFIYVNYAEESIKIASFKKIKLKGKGHAWVLTENLE